MPSIPQRQIRKQTPTTLPTKATSALSVIDRITPIEVDDWLKVVLYGESGTGKTTLWATFPGPILAILCSGAVKSNELRSINTAEYRRKVFQVVAQTTKEVYELIEHAQVSGKYTTVVLDHASGLQDMALAETLGLAGIPVHKTFGMASQQVYGAVTGIVKDIVKQLTDLPYNTVIVCHERVFKGENKYEEAVIKPMIGCALTPALAKWLPTAADYVCQTMIRNREVETVTEVDGEKIITKEKTRDLDYCLRVAANESYQCKFRVPKEHLAANRPEFIVNPDYSKIIALIEGKTS